jgi:glycosyltransferase involved in cell wall biosynthesis
MNLAIAAPSASAYSETFIHMQMDRLPCGLRIHGGPVASETIPGGPIAPRRSVLGWFDILVEVGLRGASEGPQRRELRRRMKRAKVEAVLANYGPTGVALLPVSLELDIPLIVHFHGYDAHEANVVAYHRDAYRKLGECAAAVIAVSRVMVRTLEGYGIPAGKIHLVRYGCDPARFQEKKRFPETPLFFGVGRFVDKKAPYLTVLAFKQVHDQHPNARLILGGTGGLLETTRSLAQSLGLETAAEFPGVLTQDEVANYMQQATAFVQHSIVPLTGPAKGDSEGTPVAVLEAMLSGLPVISTQHAGIGEVVEHGRTGLLVEERDVEGMAQAMLRVANDPASARTLGQQARQEALAKYTDDHYINSLNQILASASRSA